MAVKDIFGMFVRHKCPACQKQVSVKTDSGVCQIGRKCLSDWVQVSVRLGASTCQLEVSGCQLQHAQVEVYILWVKVGSLASEWYGCNPLFFKSQKPTLTINKDEWGVRTLTGISFSHSKRSETSPLLFTKRRDASLRFEWPNNLRLYQHALKLMSNPFTEWVKAPTEIKSTPHSA